MREILGISYLTEKEAAHRYGYSSSWFRNRRWVKDSPPFIKLEGKGRVLYEMQSTDDWFKKNLIEE